MMNREISIAILFSAILFGCSNADSVLISSSRNGNSDIYLIDSKGNVLEQITTNETEEWSPVWVNEDEISFISQDANAITIYSYDLKTKTLRQISHPENCTLDDKNFLYSADGSKRLYMCSGDIYLTSDNVETYNLTERLSGSANYVSWVSDDVISFTSNHEGSNDVYQINLDGSGLKKLTSGDSNNERGDIAPDGKLLVFSTNRFEKGNQDLAIKDLETNEVRRITSSKGNELIGRWTIDGRKVIFGSNKDGNWELYSYDVESEETVRLTENDSFDGDPRMR